MPGKSIACSDAKVKKAISKSFRKSKADRQFPHGSNQGVELSNDEKYIYMAGGNANTNPNPKIARFTNNSSYTKKEVIATDSEFGKPTEIEGLQIVGSDLYFGISNKPEQAVYSVPKAKF